MYLATLVICTSLLVFFIVAILFFGKSFSLGLTSVVLGFVVMAIQLFTFYKAGNVAMSAMMFSMTFICLNSRRYYCYRRLEFSHFVYFLLLSSCDFCCGRARRRFLYDRPGIFLRHRHDGCQQYRVYRAEFNFRRKFSNSKILYLVYINCTANKLSYYL